MNEETGNSSPNKGHSIQNWADADESGDDEELPPQIIQARVGSPTNDGSETPQGLNRINSNTLIDGNGNGSGGNKGGEFSSKVHEEDIEEFHEEGELNEKEEENENGVKENGEIGGDEEEMVAVDYNAFYLRYYVGHQGRYGHEFLEFTINGDGVLRYANISNYKKAASIKKEVVVSPIVVNEFKKIIEKSRIMATDDAEWPEPDVNGKQEIEIRYAGNHISFICNKFNSTAELRGANDGLITFYYLTQDLKNFVFPLISLHFKVKPIPT